MAITRWLDNANRFRVIRKFMDRAMNGQARNWRQIYFKRWKNECAKQVEMVYMEDTEQLSGQI
jgi:hypothetical protein